MRLSGHTPLCKMPAEKVSPQQQALLSSLWVESVEEFTSMMAAMEAAEESLDKTIISPLKQSEAALLEGVPEEAMAPWRLAAMGGGLGCRIDPEVLEMYRDRGQVSMPGAIMPQISDSPLPPGVRLMDELFPVRDQGRRGTCVAFSSVGLREYLDGCSAELSEQFLYWACKQTDGFPDEPGTWIRTAMSALSTQGVCPRVAWPYNLEPQPGNESQDPPSDSARESALAYVMPYTRSVTSNSVNHYKQVLSGADGFGGMPIVIASLVFNSWFRSAATHKSGKITMPLPGEQPLSGGHAMLIVGYQDDSSVPGGGYFIVRNSWGEEWACASPEAPGHALMPYAYVARYIVEAFSGQLMTGQESSVAESSGSRRDVKESPNTFEGQYTETLRREDRDIERKLLSAGTRVIRHPDARDEFMADTAGNRRRFEANNFAWSSSVRQAAWFPPKDEWDESLSTSLTRAHQQCGEFMSAIDENISTAKGKPLPDINLPFWRYALAATPRTRKVSKIVDLGERFVREICVHGLLPEGIEPPDQWARTLAGICRMQVHLVEGRAGRFHVVSAFVTPLRFGNDAAPELVTSCPGVVEIVERLYRDWAENQANVRFTFFTIGSATGWSDGMKGIADGRSWTLLSSPDGSGRWQTSDPDHFSVQLSLRNFLDRLYPETQQQRISRIKSAVDELIANPSGGNIRISTIKTKIGYRRTVIRKAFSDMQDSGHYRCYCVEDEIAIGPADARPRGIRLRPITPAFVKYHVWVLLSVLIPLLGWRLASYYETGQWKFWILWLLLPFAHIGLCMETALKRRQSDL